jgi:hypothetical protein
MASSPLPWGSSATTRQLIVVEHRLDAIVAQLDRGYHDALLSW